jgi:hypothetical protein
MPPLRVVGLLVALSELGNQAIMLDRTAVLGFAVELRAHGAPPVAGGMNRFSRRGAGDDGTYVLPWQCQMGSILYFDGP